MEVIVTLWNPRTKRTCWANRHRRQNSFFFLLTNETSVFSKYRIFICFFTKPPKKMSQTLF